MRLLDLFCKQGGASKGYADAGFEVVGVDIDPQPRYPYEFICDGAFSFLRKHGKEYDVIHASPPCQGYSHLTPKDHKGKYETMIAALREALERTGKPYIIENVTGARRELINPILLCGSMFGLMCFRHRLFEIKDRASLTSTYCPVDLFVTPPCCHDFKPLLVTTAGCNSRAIRNEGQYKSVKNAPLAYGIDWMNFQGLRECIPPAYTKFIGKELLRVL